MENERYAAFLRGINVGGKGPLKMAVLKRAGESLGFTGVTPVLASGNLVFSCRVTQLNRLAEQIERKLVSEVGLKTQAIVRSRQEILELVALDPFKSVALTAQTRLQVTFLSEPVPSTGKLPKVLFRLPFHIRQIAPGTIGSVVELSQGVGTTELMKFLEDRFAPSSRLEPGIRCSRSPRCSKAEDWVGKRLQPLNNVFWLILRLPVSFTRGLV